MLGGVPYGGYAVVHCGHRLAAAALGDHVARAAFAAAALGGHAQLELDLVKAHAGAGVARDVTVGYAAADTNDHGLKMRVVRCCDYK